MNKGAIVLIVFIITGVLVLLGTYFITFSIADTRISKSQEISANAYYLAEAGVNEAIWKLKSDNITTDGDDAWALDFIDEAKNPVGGPYWTDSFSRSFAGGTYTVSITNSERGKGQIISTATISLGGGKNAQRVIKTVVFKGLDSPIQNSAIFTGGPSENMDISFSNVRVNDGNLFCNNNLNVNWGSQLDVNDNAETEDELEGKVLVAQNISKILSNVEATAICSKDQCDPDCPGWVEGATQCPPASISMPIVDFDSVDPNSFKSRAAQAESLGQCQILCNGAPCSTKCVFTATQFSDLLWGIGQNGTMTINSVITFIDGDVELKGGKFLTVNGIIVAGGNFYIGITDKWKKGSVTQTGFDNVNVNRPSETSPSGILAENKIEFGSCSSLMATTITGIVFANDKITVGSLPWSFDITGGLLGRKISFSSVWQWFNITLDNDIILYGLGYRIDGEVITPTYSPVITIDHWEESY